MSYFKATIYEKLDVTNVTKHGIRNATTVSIDTNKAYRLIAGKPNVLFFVEIVQPTADGTDFAFKDALPTVPSDVSDFIFYLLAF